MPLKKQPPHHPAETELARENAELREALEESRHAQQKLRDTEQRLRSVIEHAPVIVFSTDRAGIFTLSEGRGLEPLGLQPGQVVGMSAFEVYRDYPQICSNLRECLSGRQANETVKVQDLVYETLYVPRRNDSGEVIGVSGVAWDVTARVRAEGTARDLEQQLRQSQKMEMVGTLAGGIAHDFNNILSPILGYSELALTDLPEGQRARADIEQVMKAARRARDLVEQILIFSRRSDQVKRPVQLHLVINEALGLIRSMIPANIEISQNIEARGDTVLADASQMHQVVMNLAMNAIYAMRKSGGVLRVELGCRDVDDATAKSLGLHPGAYVVLSVIDQGEGMDEATIGRVFEPFFTTKRPGEGTGLGLSVVHGIVLSHRGGIEVKSRPNEGATFRAYFPFVTALEAKPEESPGGEPRRGGGRVLVVDDEPAIVALLERILEANGYEVVSFTSSEEALSEFQRAPGAFNAVITDQAMPRMNGTELAAAVRRAGSAVPVLLMTGFVDRASNRDLGRDIAGVIPKPFDAATITRVLHKVLEDA
ncbi:MAG TPA: ATP-binding protein [Candidatus Krumholzibacteria bacterium]